jgi:hypothetical protein
LSEVMLACRFLFHPGSFKKGQFCSLNIKF